MRKLGFINSVVYYINILSAILLLMVYFVPLIQPGKIPFVSTLSLFTPVLMIVNVLFALYWIYKVNIRFILSLIILFLGMNHLSNFFRWANSEYVGNEDLKVMTFNVRMFNVFEWIRDSTVTQGIYDLVKKESPDVVAFQEYHKMKDFDIGNYEYSNISFYSDKEYWGQAIFSKYEIINSGKVDFGSTPNGVIYIDIDVQGVYVRVYSVHLEAFNLNRGLNKTFDALGSAESISEDVRRLAFKIDVGFGLHGEQANILRKHIDESPYPVVVMGDFNSNAFSYEYNEIKGDLVDAFKLGGTGFGRTFNFNYFPLRIDFILADPNFRVVKFETINDKLLSDHFPVTASYNIR